MDLPGLAAQFALCAALIAWAGFVLSDSADRLAQAYGWGRSWVGLAMLATVTSLPELTSGISAVAWVKAPNLAVGDALGSCVFNLAFLVVVDAFQRQQPLYAEASAVHLLTAGFGVVMLAIVAISLLAGSRLPASGHVSWSNLLLVLLYFSALAVVQRGDRAPAAMHPAPAPDRRTRLHHWRSFSAGALAVLAAGTWLPVVAERLAMELGLSRTLVGTLGLALVTSLPEMAVTLASLRLGKLDLAIANLLGSNLFNVIVLVVDDLFYRDGVLLAVAAPVHVGTALVAMAMSGLVIVGLVLRPRGRILRSVSWISAGLLAAYVWAAVLVVLMGV